MTVRMNKDSSNNTETTNNQQIQQMVELVALLKEHDVNSEHIKKYLDRHNGSGYFGEIQSVLDIKELLEAGLIK